MVPNANYFTLKPLVFLEFILYVRIAFPVIRSSVTHVTGNRSVTAAIK